MKLDRSEFFYPTPPIIITSIVGTVLIAMFHKAHEEEGTEAGWI